VEEQPASTSSSSGRAGNARRMRGIIAREQEATHEQFRR
jgi:hypothetical protein